MKPRTIAITAILLTLPAAPALAHHSFAMFDFNPAHSVVLTGTVKEFDWINPHSWLYIVVLNAKGEPEEWSFEMGSPGQLSSRGWSKDAVKVGDRVTVTAHPMKDGSRGGSELSVKLPNGTIAGSQPPSGR
jgi:hypothetical protein